jgi:hypothetical protein
MPINNNIQYLQYIQLLQYLQLLTILVSIVTIVAIVVHFVGEYNNLGIGIPNDLILFKTIIKDYGGYICIGLSDNLYKLMTKHTSKNICSKNGLVLKITSCQTTCSKNEYK